MTLDSGHRLFKEQLQRGFIVLVSLVAAGCSNEVRVSSTTATTVGASNATGSGGGGGGGGDGGNGGDGASGTTSSGEPGLPCADALFCEDFDGYDGVGSITNGQQLGSWTAVVQAAGGAMDLDTTHTTSGTRALHVRIESGATAGGHLIAGEPIFETAPTHLYVRMRVYIDPGGFGSWDYFRVRGPGAPNSPLEGAFASYTLVATNHHDANAYALARTSGMDLSDPWKRCFSKTYQWMPVAQWQCIAIEMDSEAGEFHLTLDDAQSPSHSAGWWGEPHEWCNIKGAGQHASGPWYGPAVEQVHIGALSTWPLDGPLDIWIDDLAMDTKPLSCAGL